MVVCKQLGFGAGRPKLASFYGEGTGPVLMDGLKCDGSEHTIFACPNRGWNLSYTVCSDHRNDAGVSCQPWARLSSHSKGIVFAWKKSSYQYGLVCADNFDDTAATVLCRDLTIFQKGISHCCSAYGRKNKPYVIHSVNCLGTETSLAQCDYVKSGTCLNGTYASVICTNHIPPEGSGITIHIIGGYHGYVSIDYASHPGIICSEGFDNKDATVICRQEGYAQGIAYNHNTATSSFTNTVRWLSDVSCSGTERYLHECGNLNFGKIGVCSSKKAAGVICTMNDTVSTDVGIRLVNGLSNMDGRVEINILGNWRTITSDSITELEGNVACRMAGFDDNITADFEHYGEGEFSPLISFVKCSGEEKSLLDCVLELGPVDPFNDAMGVICRFPPPSEVSIRLAGGSTYLAGRVEVEFYGDWGTVCSSGVTHSEAKVVCYMLGFPNGTLATSGQFGDGGLRPKLSKIRCDGSESSLPECWLEVAIPNKECSSLEVICNPPVRLVNGEKHFGLLEVHHDDKWWRTCASGITEKLADVLCNELGYTNGTTLCCNPFGVPNTNMTLSGIVCNDTVLSLNECTIDDVYSRDDCQRPEVYTSLLCHDDVKPDITDVRLGSDGNFGEIVVNSNQIVGSLCSDTWGYEEALVTCKGLGYSNGSAYNTLPEDMMTNGKLYWSSHIQCSGEEQDFDSCKYNSLVSDRTCFDRGTAAVYCYDKDNGIRYKIDGADTRSNHGFVEIYLNGAWTRICSTEWGNTEADVLCKELGYASGAVTLKNITSEAIDWLYEVRYKCSGRENRLENCPHSTWRNVTSQTCLNVQNHVKIQCYQSVIPTLQKKSSKTWVWILIGVLAAIIIVLIIVILMYRRKSAILKHLHDSHNQESFNHSVMRQLNDGSFLAVNPLAQCDDDRYTSTGGGLIDNKTTKNYSNTGMKKGAEKCVACGIEKGDYLTVVFQKSLINQDVENQDIEIKSDDTLHLCFECYNRDRAQQEPLYVDSQKMENTFRSHDPNPKPPVNSHTRKNFSNEMNDVSVGKTYDYVTFQKGKENMEQMADVILSLPHREEIGYPSNNEVTEL